MNYPPSLDATVVARSFRSVNGELGLLPNDVDQFLDACETDSLVVLGWELWIVNHSATPDGRVPAAASWDGGIPLKNRSIPAVVHGEAGPRMDDPWSQYVVRSIRETRVQLNSFNFGEEVDPTWLPFVRVNFTLFPRTKIDCDDQSLA